MRFPRRQTRPCGDASSWMPTPRRKLPAATGRATFDARRPSTRPARRSAAPRSGPRRPPSRPATQSSWNRAVPAPTPSHAVRRRDASAGPEDARRGGRAGVARPHTRAPGASSAPPWTPSEATAATRGGGGGGPSPHSPDPPARRRPRPRSTPPLPPLLPPRVCDGAPGPSPANVAQRLAPRRPPTVSVPSPRVSADCESRLSPAGRRVSSESSLAPRLRRRGVAPPCGPGMAGDEPIFSAAAPSDPNPSPWAPRRQGNPLCRGGGRRPSCCPPPAPRIRHDASSRDPSAGARPTRAAKPPPPDAAARPPLALLGIRNVGARWALGRPRPRTRRCLGGSIQLPSLPISSHVLPASFRRVREARPGGGERGLPRSWFRVKEFGGVGMGPGVCNGPRAGFGLYINKYDPCFAGWVRRLTSTRVSPSCTSSSAPRPRHVTAPATPRRRRRRPGLRARGNGRQWDRAPGPRRRCP